MIANGRSAALTASGLMLLATAALANPTNDLAGRWSGGGQVTLANGQTETLKCVATYTVSGGGKEVRQGLRCASTSYKIDAVANLDISGNSVSGNWEERTYSATGNITGRMTAGGFTLSISGGLFSASMQVSVSGCKQSIFITPQGLEISRITISLGKC